MSQRGRSVSESVLRRDQFEEMKQKSMDPSMASILQEEERNWDKDISDDSRRQSTTMGKLRFPCCMIAVCRDDCHTAGGERRKDGKSLGSPRFDGESSKFSSIPC